MLTFLQAESSLSLVRGQKDPRAQINSTTSPPEPFDVSDANFIIRSSDNVNFRVHRSILAMVSPFFKDLLSLPQPSDSETIDGLPVVQLSEGSELLYSLISILYPVRTVMPSSYEKVLYLFTCDLSVAIANTSLQGVIFARSVSEIRHGFRTVLCPCQGQPWGISSAKGSRGFHGIRDRECKRAHPGNGKCSPSDLGSTHDI
jgi:hypothetical protein